MSGKKFHVNPELGYPTACEATERICPFGAYDSPHEAAHAWESSQDYTSLKKSLIVSDIDGTLIKSSLVLTNASYLSDNGHIDVGDRAEKWRADMKNEELILDLAWEYRKELLGKHVSYARASESVNEILGDDQQFYSTIKKLSRYKDAGHDVLLISGSPDFVVEPFARRFGFDFIASKYEIDKDGIFREGTNLMNTAEAKGRAISKLDLSGYEEIIGLGDTSSDSPIFAVSHHSVLVDPTEITREKLKEKGIKVSREIHH